MGKGHDIEEFYQNAGCKKVSIPPLERTPGALQTLLQCLIRCYSAHCSAMCDQLGYEQ
jgi:hypothetical protein